ncbi:MAG: beta-ketoacyl-ACP synthase II [SAR202 cluster bacterium]|nr:beta-ketoacyl-ACP synthase II [SAR202 cluster bacterium]
MGNHRTRVVVTGIGAMTPLGESPDEFWDGLVAGKSGIGPMKRCDPAPYPCKVSGEVWGFDPTNYMDVKEARRMARFSQFAVAAAGKAIQDARLDLEKEDRERVGVVIGNGAGAFDSIEEQARVLIEKGGMRMSPYFMSMMLANMAAANVSRLYGTKGYSNTVVTACAAGTQGLGEALEVIRRGAADVLLAGGTEAGISALGQGGFNVIKALSRRNDPPEKASRPFDAERDGFVPAEGGAILVLETLEHAQRRGANILAELIGQGVSSDAFHQVQPDETGQGPARAIRWALADAGITIDDIDYINAHGTSTPINDAAETLAIKNAFGERAYKVPISSTKSMTGHALGGAGGLEAVVAIKTILTGTIHPTINYEHPDPRCDLDYVPNVARKKTVDTVLSNSFGFGGQNACLVVRRFVN